MKVGLTETLNEELELTSATSARDRVTWSVYWHLLTSRSVHLPGLTQR